MLLQARIHRPRTRAAKLSDEEWAEGVPAIDFLARGSMATSTPKLSVGNRRAAERIIQRADREHHER